MHTVKSHIHICLLICLMPLWVAAQGGELPTGLAVEVERHAGTLMHIAVPGRVWTPLFRRVEGWQLPAGALPVRAVEVAARVDGDQVRLYVSVHRGEKYHDLTEQVAEFALRAGEQVVIRDLGKYGVTPFELTVVRVKPSESAAPAIVNQAGSLEVLGVEKQPATFTSYFVRVRNNSGKGVRALKVHYFSGPGGPASFAPHRERDQTLIEPGAVYEIDVRDGSGGTGQRTPDGYTPPGVEKVVILAALFDDGSYEGEVEHAAGMRAWAVGNRLQITRLLNLIRAALDAPDGDETAAVEDFKRQVSALDLKAAAGALDELLAQYPKLKAGASQRLVVSVEVSMHRVRTELLDELKKFEANRRPAVEGNNFRRWLRDQLERYEQWRAGS